VNVANLIKIKHEKYWLLSEEDIHKEATSILNDNIPISILQRIHNNRGPIFVATDGSHKVTETNNTFNRPKNFKNQRTRIRQGITEERKKFCTGTACNRMYTTWNFELKPSLINFNLKHCQQCAKQQTAFKKGAQILDHCMNHSTQTRNDNLIQHLDETLNDINYNGIMQRIHIDKTSSELKNTKKQRIADAQKGTLKTISTCITKLTNCNDPPNKRLKLAKKILQDTPITSNKFLKDDLKHNIDINTVLLDTKSYDQKSIIKKELKDSDQIQKSTNDTEETRIRGDIASALVNNQWMFSYS